MEKGAVILIIRSILTMWLCYAIFCETGPFTAFAFFLIFLSIEIIAAYMRQANKLAGEVIRKERL
jgi:hypothetical protein